jgi:hypothetical protein
VLPLGYTVNECSEQKINDFYDRNEYLLASLTIRAVNKFSRFIIGQNIL